MWWECILESCDNNKRAEVAVVCRSLWKAMNEVVWNKKFTRLYIIIARAKQYLEKWRHAQRLGLVVRDSDGAMILAKTVRINEVLDLEMAEVMAIKEALSWTKNQTWQKITIESDCLVVVHSIRSRAPMSSPFGRIVQQCRGLMQEQNGLLI
ncbi:uncharacterized protein LOC141660037 [Apium graveolens]|uniref:uncharacterized protein LOC141660037 n=1 Tax=Apium graveolens TaxID=4045 RepID=UPI003D79ADB0